MSVTTAFQNRWWWGKDSNLRRQCRQIYNLLPLATREPHHGVLLIVWLSPEKMSVATASQNRWWWGKDSNLRRQCRQIYNLLPLATREPHHGVLLIVWLSPEKMSVATTSQNRWWWGKDSNLRRQCRQIYNLLPLATREPHHGVLLLFGFRQKRCQWRQLLKIDGGGGRIRTFEGSAGRFTICSLWPLGNPTTSAGRIIANIPIL